MIKTKTIYTLFSLATLPITILNGYSLKWRCIIPAQEQTYTSLYEAIKGEDISKIEEIISLQKNKQAFINEGLLVAAETKDPDFITYFLNKGADINAKDRYADRTALHCVVGKGNLECVQMLLAAGADINALTYWSRLSPIFIAIEKHDLEMVKLLAQAGARLDIKSYWLGQTIMHAAINANDPHILTYLIQAGAPLNMRDKRNRTPYMFASEQKSTQLIEIITNAQPEITAEDLTWIETKHKEQEELRLKLSQNN
jgi:ankyrin repeat protein